MRVSEAFAVELAAVQTWYSGTSGNSFFYPADVHHVCVCSSQVCLIVLCVLIVMAYSSQAYGLRRVRVRALGPGPFLGGDWARYFR